MPWTVFWVLMVVRLHQAPQPAVYGLLFSTLTWVGAAPILLGRWWSGTGYGSTALDPPGALLVAAVVALPKRRREWGTAILAELAEVRGRSERWGFALSSVRATLSLRPVGGWPVLSLVAAAVVAAVVTAGRVVGGVMPELDVFATSFGHDQGQDPGSPEPVVRRAGP